MRFRPCIDLKDGVVTQIVGGTIGPDEVTNYKSTKDALYFSRLYKEHGLKGGHLIRLGGDSQKNHCETVKAVEEYPNAIQVGGGLDLSSARRYLEAGASHAVFTSFVFREGEIDWGRLTLLEEEIGKRDIVLDLSCRRKDGDYFVVTDRWQKFTNFKLQKERIEDLSQYCDEFLVHGVDVEGRMQGIERDLVAVLGDTCKIPVTYAGGVRHIADLELIREIGRGCVDASIGSALDIFGGDLPFATVIQWNNSENGSEN